ncbi:MAG: hypothetical protein ABI553_00025 [Chloroflexota bacterium]
MTARFKKLGLALMVAGLAFVLVGGYTFVKTQEGAKSLQAFSTVENVTLKYNDQGQLTDGGKVEGAVAIMSLLQNDWGYPVVAADLNPNDPVVNTATEYMYQMATVTEHTLNAKVTVTLPADVTAANGQVFKAGDYEFQNTGKYWTGFDRTNPIEALAREKVWTGTALALVGQLGVGTVTASALQMGLGIAGIAGAMGGLLLLFGLGLIWAARPETEKVHETEKRPQTGKVLEPAKLSV